MLLAGAEVRIDLGRVEGGALFAFAVGVGIDARMIEETPPAFKRRFGVLAYFIMASRAAFVRRDFRLRVVVDGESVERPAAAMLVANFGALLRDFVHLGPDIMSDDGLLDLCVFSPDTLGDAARIAWRMWRKDFRPDPCLLYRRGRHFRIETDPVQTVQADGELVGRTPFEVSVVPLGARLLAPKFD
jgi:diacylglycerol kinase family enzyme